MWRCWVQFFEHAISGLACLNMLLRRASLDKIHGKIREELMLRILVA